ncbi:MAG: protocatechuate 3,4-dioxygenase beta subunit [Planctomycetota bacterium]|jgi:protocatechuate 3,4-dioxygenase beta subunit
MKPLGVLLFVIVAVGVLFFTLFSSDQDGSQAEIDSISQGPATTSPTQDKPTDLQSATGAERNTVPIAATTSERVDEAPLTSEQFANSVSGRVLSPDFKPLAGAKVTLTRAGLGGMMFQNEPMDRSKDRFTTSDAEGEYTFLNIEPWDQYSVEADAEHYCRAEMSPVSVDSMGTSTQPDIILSLGASLSGTIMDTAGNPVPGAQVTLEGLFGQFNDTPSPDSLLVTSESDGTYMISNVEAGNRRLQITAEGYANQSKSGLVFRDEEPLTTDVTMEIAEMICGKVTSKAGGPVANAKVLGISFSNTNRQCRDQVYTDENGDFCLEHLAAGKYTLAVSADGFRRLQETRVQTGGSGLVLELEEQGMVNGRLVVSAGELPTNFEVQLRQVHQGNTVTSLIGKSYPMASEDGSYSIECPQSGTFKVQAIAEGYAPGFSEEFRFTMGQGMSGVTIQMTQGGSIIGRVVDGEGNPVGRPRVETHDNTWTNNLFDRALGDQFPTNITKAAATGNDAGKFRLKMLRPETYQLRIRASGFCEFSMVDTLVTEGNETNIGDIVMIKGGEISGSVIDLAGRPVVGAKIRLNPEGNQGTPHSYETKSGSGGKYVVPNIYPGKYKLTAVKTSGPADFFGEILAENDNAQVVNVSDGQALRFELKVAQ